MLLQQILWVGAQVLVGFSWPWELLEVQTGLVLSTRTLAAAPNLACYILYVIQFTIVYTYHSRRQHCSSDPTTCSPFTVPKPFSYSYTQWVKRLYYHLPRVDRPWFTCWITITWHANSNHCMLLMWHYMSVAERTSRNKLKVALLANHIFYIAIVNLHRALLFKYNSRLPPPQLSNVDSGLSGVGCLLPHV